MVQDTPNVKFIKVHVYFEISTSSGQLADFFKRRIISVFIESIICLMKNVMCRRLCGQQRRHVLSKKLSKLGLSFYSQNDLNAKGETFLYIFMNTQSRIVHFYLLLIPVITADTTACHS